MSDTTATNNIDLDAVLSDRWVNAHADAAERFGIGLDGDDIRLDGLPEAFAKHIALLGTNGRGTVSHDAVGGTKGKVYKWLKANAAVPPTPTSVAIVVVDGPRDMYKMAHFLCNLAGKPTTDEIITKDMSAVGIWPTAGWADYVEVGRDPVTGPLLKDNAELIPESDALTLIRKAGVMDSVVGRNVVVVCRLPRLVKRDENFNLHCDDGPAIQWRNGNKAFFVHGVRIHSSFFYKESALAQPASAWAALNTEARRLVCARVGWDAALGAMGASRIDVWTDPASELGYELYSVTSADFKLLRKQSPMLKDGTQPWYVEPMPVTCTSAAEARAMQVPELVGFESDGTPIFELRSPNNGGELAYAWEA